MVKASQHSNEDYLSLKGVFHRATKLLIEEQWRGPPSPDRNFYPSTKLIDARPISLSLEGFIRRRMRDFSAHQNLELLAKIKMIRIKNLCISTFLCLRVSGDDLRRHFVTC